MRDTRCLWLWDLGAYLRGVAVSVVAGSAEPQLARPLRMKGARPWLDLSGIPADELLEIGQMRCGVRERPVWPDEDPA